MLPWSMVMFSAMGSPCRIVASDHDLATHGERLVKALERRWSRFLPDTEISALNASAGCMSIVSPPTYELIARAEEARLATHGVFNPLVLDQLEALGYDRSWPVHPDSPNPVARAVPVCDEAIELYPEISAVRLPAGARFDPGGIGKGLAGDMVAAELVNAGSASVQVELGGDVRVAGESWSGGAWEVVVDDVDHGASRAATISLAEGGVATSSVRRRRWRRGGTDLHHLVDTATGSSAVTDLDAVTAVASTLWWAEVVAKVALMRGASGARHVLDDFGMTGVLVHADAERRYDVVAGSGLLA